MKRSDEYIKQLYQRAERKYNRLANRGVEREEFTDLFGFNADILNTEYGAKKKINYDSYKSDSSVIDTLEDFVKPTYGNQVILVKGSNGEDFFATREQVMIYNQTVEPIREYRQRLDQAISKKKVFNLREIPDVKKYGKPVYEKQESLRISTLYETDVNTVNLNKIDIVRGYSTNKGIKTLRDLKSKTNYYKQAQSDVYGENFEGLKDHWLKAIRHKGNITSYAYRKIYGIMKGISNEKFLYLFYHTDVFTFDFIYSEDQLDNLFNQVRTYAEALNTKGNAINTLYQEFRKIYGGRDDEETEETT